MAMTTIEWTATPRPDGTLAPGYSFNPWRGCTKISPGCAACYAETWSQRNPSVLGVWGDRGTRVVAAESYWAQPLKWDREAKAASERRRVFCASLADVFEDWQGAMVDSHGDQIWRRDNGSWTTSDHYRDTVALTLGNVRERLFRLIHDTPNLDWLLLTKRPQNFTDMLPWGSHDTPARRPWKNVWLGVSVENQQYADERIPLLLQTPAAIRFLSCEPLLGPLSLSSALTMGRDADEWEGVSKPFGRPNIHWAIIGGESGHGARPCDVAWVRSLVQQCQTANVACFVKQLGKNPVAVQPCRLGAMSQVLRLRDPKGGDVTEFPPDLQVREFPECAYS